VPIDVLDPGCAGIAFGIIAGDFLDCLVPIPRHLWDIHRVKKFPPEKN